MMTVVGGVIGRGGYAESGRTTSRTEGSEGQTGDKGHGNKRADEGNRERHHIPSHKSKVKVVAAAVKYASAAGKRLLVR
jgi:hypothetical protein